VTAILTSGSWQLTTFSQQSKDKGNGLIGSTFTFSTDGTVKATTDKEKVNGTWNYTPAVTYYGSSSKSAIQLNFGTGAPFILLTKKWNLITISASTLQLDNPEIIEGKHLVFAKKLIQV